MKTPIKLFFDHDSSLYVFRDADGIDVYYDDIVRRCNAHDALVAMVRELTNAIKAGPVAFEHVEAAEALLTTTQQTA